MSTLQGRWTASKRLPTYGHPWEFRLFILLRTGMPHWSERAKSTDPFGYLLKPCTDQALSSAIEIALYKSELEKKSRGERATGTKIWQIFSLNLCSRPTLTGPSPSSTR